MGQPSRFGRSRWEGKRREERREDEKRVFWVLLGVG
jgi:hypothetical protein